MTIKLRIQQHFDRRAFGIWLMRYQGGKTLVAKPTAFEFVEYDSAFLLPDATLTFSPEEFHELRRAAIDESVGAGLEPTAIKLAGKLEATERHLEDMRRLVFAGQASAPS